MSGRVTLYASLGHFWFLLVCRTGFAGTFRSIAVDSSDGALGSTFPLPSTRGQLVSTNLLPSLRDHPIRHDPWLVQLRLLEMPQRCAFERLPDLDVVAGRYW